VVQRFVPFSSIHGLHYPPEAERGESIQACSKPVTMLLDEGESVDIEVVFD